MTRKLSCLCGTAILLISTSIPLSSQAPLKTTVCDLLQNPPAFNHKRVELQAFVSRGFEDFTLFDPTCNVYPPIWLEYGGRVNSGTIYFGPASNSRNRPEDLVVENIPISLVADDTFRSFDERIHIPGLRGHAPLTRATLVGTYFAGRKETYPSGASAWSGFGHFGCCTLLAIQQVEEATLTDGAGLDPYSSPEPVIPGFKSNRNYWFSLIPEDVSKFILESQQEAEQASGSTAFDDPEQVAISLIRSAIHGKPIEPAELKVVSKRDGFVEYELRIPSMGTRFSVAVDKPSWLAFYARNPKQVAWVALWAKAERINEKRPMTLPK
jgi:hypothetical protein